MTDQAKSLRRLVNDATGSATDLEVRPTKVIAIVSGKGGVGKSNFSLNFALELLQNGKKVIIFDLDIGMANIDILMGITSKNTVVDMIENRLSIFDIIEEGPENLAFIAGGSGLGSLFQLNPQKLSRFLQQLELINGKYDYILFDMGAGASEDILHFILAANEIIVVTTPEPTSVTDAYAMVKFIKLKDNKMPISLLINRVESEKEGKRTFNNLQLVVNKFLKGDINLAGIIPNDPVVLKAVKAQTPFVLYAVNSKPSRAIKAIVQQYLGETTKKGTNLFPSFINKLKGFFGHK